MSSSWTPKLHFCGQGSHFQIVIRNTLIVFCAVLLPACGPIFPDNNDSPKAVPPPAGIRAESGSESYAQSVPPPPAHDTRPLDPSAGTGPPPIDEARLQAMQPPQGMTPNRLFDRHLGDSDARLNRLENAVQGLRNDVDFLAPAVLRLVTIEKDLQNLIGQIEVLLEPGQSPAPAPAAAVPATDPVRVPAAVSDPLPLQNIAQAAPAEGLPEAAEEVSTPVVETPKAEPPPPTPPKDTGSGSTQVYDLRVGEHTDKTRLVLDVSTQTPYSTDLDNEEKLLVVELPEATWSAEKVRSFPASKVLASYRVDSVNNGQGSLLVLQLKSSATILFSGKLPAANGTGQRIVIDLGGAPTN